MLNHQKKYARHAIAKTKVQFTETDEPFIEESLKHQKNPDTTTINEYICEVCGKVENLTEKDAFESGWDYPPFMGIWGVVSPRTCGDCLIDKTAYWHLLTKGSEDIPEHHMTTIKRILEERIVVNE